MKEFNELLEKIKQVEGYDKLEEIDKEKTIYSYIKRTLGDLESFYRDQLQSKMLAQAKVDKPEERQKQLLNFMGSILANKIAAIFGSEDYPEGFFRLQKSKELLEIYEKFLAKKQNLEKELFYHLENNITKIYYPIYELQFFLEAYAKLQAVLSYCNSASNLIGKPDKTPTTTVTQAQDELVIASKYISFTGRRTIALPQNMPTANLPSKQSVTSSTQSNLTNTESPSHYTSPFGQLFRYNTFSSGGNQLITFLNPLRNSLKNLLNVVLDSRSKQPEPQAQPSTAKRVISVKFISPNKEKTSYQNNDLLQEALPEQEYKEVIKVIEKIIQLAETLLSISLQDISLHTKLLDNANELNNNIKTNVLTRAILAINQKAQNDSRSNYHKPSILRGLPTKNLFRQSSFHHTKTLEYQFAVEERKRQEIERINECSKTRLNKHDLTNDDVADFIFLLRCEERKNVKPIAVNYLKLLENSAIDFNGKLLLFVKILQDSSAKLLHPLIEKFFSNEEPTRIIIFIESLVQRSKTKLREELNTRNKKRLENSELTNESFLDLILLLQEQSEEEANEYNQDAKKLASVYLKIMVHPNIKLPSKLLLTLIILDNENEKPLHPLIRNFFGNAQDDKIICFIEELIQRDMYSAEKIMYGSYKKNNRSYIFDTSKSNDDSYIEAFINKLNRVTTSLIRERKESKASENLKQILSNQRTTNNAEEKKQCKDNTILYYSVISSAKIDTPRPGF